jgi:butyryl-CoA dehydrogenase
MVLSEKHEEFAERIREFARSEIAPVAAGLDSSGEFSWELFKKLAQAKFLGVPFPEEYGGAGLDTLCYAITVEEISRVCGSTGIFVAAHTSLGCYPIWAAGTEEQKKKWLVPMCRGEKTGSFGLTEPNAGSDAAGTETTAQKVGNKYVINGAKRFITSGAIGEFITFTATQDKSKGSHGISAFVVEKGTPGFSSGKDEDKLGLRGSITSELIFEDCEIPCENLIGEEGKGFKVFMQTLDGGRISIGAMALGIAQGALDASIEFVKERGSHKSQFIQGAIADMATKVAAARGLIYHASVLKDQGKPFTKEAAMGKYYAADIGMSVCTKAVEICGSAGLTKKYAVERFMRDQKLTEIGEGTSEIQRIVIARQILGR